MTWHQRAIGLEQQLNLHGGDVVSELLTPARDTSEGYRNLVLTPVLESVFQVVDTRRKTGFLLGEKMHKAPNMTHEDDHSGRWRSALQWTPRPC